MNATNDTQISISKPARIIYGVICTSMIMVGFLMYSLYVVTVVRKKELRKQYYFQLTIGLAISDCCWNLLAVAVGLPLIFTGNTESSWIPNETAQFMIGYLFQTVPFYTSVAYVNIIAVNRYLAVCYFTKLDNIFNKCSMRILLIIPWVFGFTWGSFHTICGCKATFNVLGWTLECGTGLVTCGQVSR